MLRSIEIAKVPNYYQKENFQLHKWGPDSCCVVTCFHSEDYQRLYYSNRKPTYQKPDPYYIILYLN